MYVMLVLIEFRQVITRSLVDGPGFLKPKEVRYSITFLALDLMIA
jgi:hypothetical protein